MELLLHYLQFDFIGHAINSLLGIKWKYILFLVAHSCYKYFVNGIDTFISRRDRKLSLHQIWNKVGSTCSSSRIDSTRNWKSFSTVYITAMICSQQSDARGANIIAWRLIKFLSNKVGCSFQKSKNFTSLFDIC